MRIERSQDSEKTRVAVLNYGENLHESCEGTAKEDR